MACSEPPPGAARGAGDAPPPALSGASVGEVMGLLAARTPSPGGGSAAAITAATAAALTEMAAGFALARAPDRVLTELAGRAAELRARLLELADADRAPISRCWMRLRCRMASRCARRRCARRSPRRRVCRLRSPPAQPLSPSSRARSRARPETTRSPGTRASRSSLADAATSAAAALVCLNLEGAPEDARAADAKALASRAAGLRAALGEGR